MAGLLVILPFAGLSALALDDAVSIKLKAQSNAGRTGSATAFPEADKTRVAIEVLNAPTARARGD